MSAALIMFGLITVFISIFNNQMVYAEQIHYRYMLERSLKSATLAAYEKETVNESFKEFKSIFMETCPKDFIITIELKNFERYPKFVHYKIEAQDNKGHEYVLEESMIEEDKR